MSKGRNLSTPLKSLLRVFSAMFILVALMAIAGFAARIAVSAMFRLMLGANMSLRNISALAICVLVLLVIAIWRGWLNRPRNVLIVRPVIRLITAIAPLEHFDEIFRKKSDD